MSSALPPNVAAHQRTKLPGQRECGSPPRTPRRAWRVSHGVSAPIKAVGTAAQPVLSFSGLPGRLLGAYAVLLGVSDGDTDSRNDHGGMRDWRIRMTVDRNRRHHAEPRQQVIAPTTLSSRDDPTPAR